MSAKPVSSAGKSQAIDQSIDQASNQASDLSIDQSHEMIDENDVRPSDSSSQSRHLGLLEQLPAVIFVYICSFLSINTKCWKLPVLSRSKHWENHMESSRQKPVTLDLDKLKHGLTAYGGSSNSSDRSELVNVIMSMLESIPPNWPYHVSWDSGLFVLSQPRLAKFRSFLSTFGFVESI